MNPEPLSADEHYPTLPAMTAAQNEWHALGFREAWEMAQVRLDAQAEQIRVLREALGLFASYADILDAMAADGQFEEPLSDHTWVVQTTFPGGSIGIAVGDLREARAALAGLKKVDERVSLPRSEEGDSNEQDSR